MGVALEGHEHERVGQPHEQHRNEGENRVDDLFEHVFEVRFGDDGEHGPHAAVDDGQQQDDLPVRPCVKVAALPFDGYCFQNCSPRRAALIHCETDYTSKRAGCNQSLAHASGRAHLNR